MTSRLRKEMVTEPVQVQGSELELVRELVSEWELDRELE